jgi:hypothetical protein
MKARNVMPDDAELVGLLVHWLSCTWQLRCTAGGWH